MASSTLVVTEHRSASRQHLRYSRSLHNKPLRLLHQILSYNIQFTETRIHFLKFHTPLPIACTRSNLLELEKKYNDFSLEQPWNREDNGCSWRGDSDGDDGANEEADEATAGKELKTTALGCICNHWNLILAIALVTSKQSQFIIFFLNLILPTTFATAKRSQIYNFSRSYFSNYICNQMKSGCKFIIFFKILF